MGYTHTRIDTDMYSLDTRREVGEGEREGEREGETEGGGLGGGEESINY